MYHTVDDTIIAVATAAGRCALGIVRLSGPAALDIVDRFTSTESTRRISEHPSSSRFAGDVTLSEQRSLPAVFYLFTAPRSYPRQDPI